MKRVLPQKQPFWHHEQRLISQNGIAIYTCFVYTHTMIWDIAALVFSLLAAVAIHLNHIFRLDGMVLVCLRSVATAFLFLPFGLLLPWPEDWRFYLCAALVGLCGNLADRLVFDSAATYGSRLTCLYVPLKIWLAFVLWTVLDPASLTALADPAWKIPAILGCLGLTTAAVFLLRKNDASWCALAHLAPVGVLLAGADIFVKKCMAPYDILPYALVFTFFISVSQVVWSFILFGFYN